jgi:autotransporter-associated beta strand protein
VLFFCYQGFDTHKKYENQNLIKVIKIFHIAAISCSALFGCKTDVTLMSSIKFLPRRLSQAIFVALTFNLAVCHGDDNGSKNKIIKPAMPSGLGAEQVVDVPDVVYPLPSITYLPNNGDSTLKRIISDNPVPYLLKGINEIWQGTSDEYQNASSGNGPDEYLSDPIVDKAVWEDNISYVIAVTNNRTNEESIRAFLDDRRSKNYSVIDGYGPLTEEYVANSESYTDIAVPTTAQVLQDEHYLADSNDGSAYTGNQDAALGSVVALVSALRNAHASTSAPKYIFSTPRPWRMADDGSLEFLGTDKNYTCVDSSGTENTHIVDLYTTSVSVVPGLMCNRRPHSSSHHDSGLYTEDTENRRKDGGYPSGHTNAGFLAAMAYAYALPQRYSEMVMRASDLGESRILAGMHSPVDVIGGRIQSMIVTSWALNQSDIYDTAVAAYNQAQSHFGDLAEAAGMSLYDFAHRTVEDEAGLIDGDNVNIEVYDNNIYSDHEANKALYRFRMTYGLSQDASKAGQEPIVPDGAEALLKSRQPYLTDDQRRAVLYTTSIDSGYPILDETNGWGRLDLVTAADGYGAFLGDVHVVMDADEGAFNAHDRWQNDISGEGMLSKDGSGQLTLTGTNTYSGGTLVKGGTLEAESTSAFGKGDLYVEDGTVQVDADGALEIAGNFTMDAGTLELLMDADHRQLKVDGVVFLEGGELRLDFSDFEPAKGSTVTLLTGRVIKGQFDHVTAEGYSVTLEYRDTRVLAHLGHRKGHHQRAVRSSDEQRLQRYAEM